MTATVASLQYEDVSVVEAINRKYSASSFESRHCVIIMPAKAPGRTDSGEICVPHNLILDSAGITSAGVVEELRSLCNTVTELDLSNNRITAWSEVLVLMQSMPTLEFLNLTRNPLEALEESHDQSFPHMRKLVLNFTKITWNSIKYILHMMPNLTELYLSGNCFTEVSLHVESYSSLQLLQLTSNNLHQWEDIVKLDQLFPNLTNLILAENNIITCGVLDHNEGMFQNLHILNMNNTGVKDWNELDKLSVFAQLEDIRLVGIPLLKSFDEVKKRQMMSVYFPHVQRINGSTMSDSERDAAERIFLRHFMNGNETTKPRRYDVLESKHGNLDELGNVTLAPKTSMKMTVQCGDRREEMEINTKQSIGQLKKLLRPIVGTAKYRLFLVPKYEEGHPTEITALQNNKLVWSMNWEEGDSLYCDDPNQDYTPPQRMSV